MASALDNPQCDLCMKRHITKEASVWCFECKETLCFDCNEIHQSQNVTKDHNRIQIADYQMIKPVLTTIKYECEQHGVTFDCYCGDHDMPICAKCVTELHKTCTQIKSLTGITENIKESFLFTDLKERASDIQIVLQQIIEEVSSKRAKVEEETDRAISIVECTRVEINRHLDLLQDDIINNIRKNENDQKDQINRVLLTFQALLHDAEETNESVAQADKHAPNLHTYCGIKVWNEKIQRLENRLSSLQKNLQHFQCFEVDVNLKLKNFQTEITEFASIKSEHTKSDVKTLAKERQGQTLIANPAVKTDMTLSNRHVFTLPTGENRLSIHGCCIMESSTIIFTDNENQRLIIVDERGKPCKNVNLPFRPYDVVEVDSHTVAVTSDRDKKLVLVDINKDKVIRTVYEGEWCFGVCYMKIERKFFVNVPAQKFRIIGLDGKVLDTIYNVGNTTFCCVDNDNFYYAEHQTDTVYCCDMVGQVRWKYTCKKCDYPIGITVDNNNNVFVSCRDGNKVMCIDKTGKRSRVLLTKKHGIKDPWAIAYSKKNNTLLVANRSDGMYFVCEIN